MRERVWNDSRNTREHIMRLERELRKNPKDETLRGHIRQLKKAWGLQRGSAPSPNAAAA